MENGLAFRSMIYFRMELQSESRLAGGGIGSHPDIFGAGNNAAVRGKGIYSVPVGHPYLGIGPKVFQQGILPVNEIQSGAAIFPGIGLLDLTPVVMRKILCTVADPQ
jgi:hypothetical protein